MGIIVIEQLSGKDQERVTLGNRCFKSAIQITHWLDSYGIPWILENPAKCWYLPPLKQLANANFAQSSLTFANTAAAGESVQSCYVVIWMLRMWQDWRSCALAVASVQELIYHIFN